MSKQIRLALDLDGVLFNFNQAFVELARKEFPFLQCPDPGMAWPTKWDYLDDFLSPQQIRHLWDIVVVKNHWFWEQLPTYSWSQQLLQSALDKSDKLYFITSRSGPKVQFQTEEALRQLYKSFGSIYRGAVLPVARPEDKLPLINALRCTHFVDDKPETVVWAKEQCPKTHTAIWHQPWNFTHLIDPRLVNVKDFDNFLGFV